MKALKTPVRVFKFLQLHHKALCAPQANEAESLQPNQLRNLGKKPFRVWDLMPLDPEELTPKPRMAQDECTGI